MSTNQHANPVTPLGRTTRHASSGGRHFRAMASRLGACLCWFAGIAAFLVFALLVTGMLGCGEPRADFRGQQVSEAELPRIVESAIRKQQEADRLEAEGIAREAAKRQAAFELAVSRHDAEHMLDLVALRAEYEASAASTRDALAAVNRRSEDAIVAIRNDAASTATAIQIQNEQRLGALAFVEKVLPMTPAAPFTDLIMPGLIGVLGIERIRKGMAAGKAEKEAIVTRDANYEEGYKRGKEEAEALRKAADDAWDLAEARALNMVANKAA